MLLSFTFLATPCFLLLCVTRIVRVARSRRVFAHELSRFHRDAPQVGRRDAECLSSPRAVAVVVTEGLRHAREECAPAHGIRPLRECGVGGFGIDGFADFAERVSGVTEGVAGLEEG